jgi:hypothetical protein
MKATSNLTKSVFFAAVLACIIAVSGSAFAQQAIRNPGSSTPNNDFCSGGDGNDCPDWGESVNISETSSLEPVVVTFSLRYFVNVADVYYVGLDVNGSGCITDFYGPTNLDDISTNPAGHFLTATYQWVILPSDGLLVSGKNTFEVCGGGNSSGDAVTIGVNTLTVAKN